jgi:nucleoside-diphosphate-sugar epimerase
MAAISGLASRIEKGFYIQTSGAFLISEATIGTAGSGKIWSDIADIELLKRMPPTCCHQITEQIVRNAAIKVNVNIVSPTLVYGLSSSTENRIHITIRDIVATVNELSAGFTVAQGVSILGYIYVEDLADIYVRLISDAVNGPDRYNSYLWGPYAP